MNLGHLRQLAADAQAGLSVVPGFWNTIGNVVPSSRRRSPGRRVARSRPSKHSWATVTSPGYDTSWATARAVTDLPEPDSPTIPTISPRRTVSDTSRTASTSPSGVGNVTDRPLTASRMS